MNRRIALTILMLIETFLSSGCESGDERLARLATESANRQARQSEALTDAHASLTKGAQQLTQSAGRSQEALISLQHELRAQEAEIGRQRDRIESERKALAAERRTSPIIAAAVLDVGSLALCTLPLILAWFVLRKEPAGATDSVITDTLIEQIITDRAGLLSHSDPCDSSEPTCHLPRPT